MVCLAGLIHLPRGLQLTLALVVLCGHNLLDQARVVGSSVLGALMYGGPFTPVVVEGAPRIWVIYALAPWAAVLLLGYVAGPVFDKPRGEQRRMLLALGLGATLLFVALRALDGYGDPTPMAEHVASAEEAGRHLPMLSVIAFLNTTKYPPSLLYLLMTLGPALLFLALCPDSPGRLGRALVQFGRVPLFFYAVHIYLIHLGSRLYYRVTHGEPASAMQTLFDLFFQQPPKPVPEWFGNGLGTVYVAWLVTVVALYPLCVWYGRLKARGRSRLWSYL